MKLFDNPRAAVIAILAVIVLFAAYKCNATELEVGATYTGEFNGGVGISVIERLSERIDVGITLLSDQEWENVRVSNNGVIWFALVAERPEKWYRWLPGEVSIGAARWFKAQSPIQGCETGYLLSLKWPIKRGWNVGWRHWSNAGICPPNRGQDMLAVGYSF